MKEYLAARDWLVAALEAGETEGHLVSRLLAGTAQLWLGERCAMVTEIVNGPPRAIHVWLAGGELKEIVSLTPGIAAFARSMGCAEATVNGRKGWGRALRKHGFEGFGQLRKVL